MNDKHLSKDIKSAFQSLKKLFPEFDFSLFLAPADTELSAYASTFSEWEKKRFIFKKPLPEKEIFPNKIAENQELTEFIENNRLVFMSKFDDKFMGILWLGIHYSGLLRVKFRKDLIRVMKELVTTRLRSAEFENKWSDGKHMRRQMLEEISAMHDIGRSLQSGQNLDDLLTYIMGKCMVLMDSEAGSLMLVAPDTDELEFKVALGPVAHLVKPFRLKIGQGISGWVAQHGQAILIPDAYADPRFDPSFDKRTGFRTRSYLCVPLIYDRKVLGVMTVLNRLDGQPFGENDLDLLTTFASQAAMAIENHRLLKAALEKERLDRELQIAAEIQQRLIPRQIPLLAGLDMAATYRPCKEVGGDFYDIIPLNDHQVVLIVADVAGKGIPGAMLVSTMQASLKAYLEFTQDLLQIVAKLNQLLVDNTMDDSYITFFMAKLDRKSGKLEYVNAGHNPPLLVNNSGAVEELHDGGIFLGFLPWEYQLGSLNLGRDSLLVMYTDGLVEAMNAEEEFGEQRLKKLIRQLRGRQSAEIKDTIYKRVDDFIAHQPLQDDFTLLVVKRT